MSMNFYSYGPDEGMERKEIDLLNYWHILWRRRWTVAACALVVLAVVAFCNFTASPTYTGKGTLLIEKEPNILTFEEIFQIESFRDDYYQTQYKLLQSRALAERTVDRLELYEHPEFADKPGDGENPADEGRPAQRLELVEAFLGRLEVRPVRMTRLVEVSFEAHDPELAAAAVNGLFDSFIDWDIETRYEATEQATEFLTGQIASLQAEVSQKERELQSYGREKNIVALSDQETTIIDKLGEVNRALTEAQIDRVKKEAYYNEVKNLSPDYIPEALTNPLIQRLREEYVRLRREYQKKLETFQPEYPEMVRLNAELNSARDLLMNEAQNLIKGAHSEYQAALKKESSLEEVFNRQKQEAFSLNSNSITYNALKTEIVNKKSLLESLQRRHSEMGVAARQRGLRTANLRVVDGAVVPVRPSSPKKKRNLILALVVGLMIGVGAAFAFEYLDNTVKTGEDVEKCAGVPLFGIVPSFSRDGYRKGFGYGDEARKGRRPVRKGLKVRLASKKKWDKSSTGRRIISASTGGAGGEKAEARPQTIELIPHYAPASGFAESYRTIRTSLLLSSASENLKAMVISSPLPSEGKTVTAANLGVTLAQANRKVLIVDTDLRKPRIHRLFKMRNTEGLTNYLVSDMDYQSLIKKTEIKNLYIVNSGPVPPNPAELLDSEKMTRFLEYARQYFQHILFDSPPVLTVSDALVLGPITNGMILIVWGEKTSREALKRAREKLDLTRTKMLGVIINNLDVHKHEYYYKHYYYDYYRHYGEQ
jgi:succinoglycan biosynthesis transport protein ExoP